MARPDSRRAFSILELLVVIAIIAVMIGLLLPAVQKVREIANRARCQNNMRQIGIGLHQFHEIHSRLPAAKIHSGSAGSGQPQYRGPEGDFRGDTLKIYNHTGWVALLPFIEQEALFQKYDYRQPSSNSSFGGGLDGTSLAGSANANAGVVGSEVRIYGCPADRTPSAIAWDNGQPADPSANPPTPYIPPYHIYSRQNARRSNYLFASYKDTDFTPRYPSDRVAGAFGTNGAASFSQITDGLSRTVLVGESRQEHTSTTHGPYWGSGTHSCCHGVVTDQRWAINYRYGEKELNEKGKEAMLQYAWGFGSWHPGGANFLFGDGSVHLISDRIKFETFQALNTINGGESLEWEMP
jgi:prepilin-type processing-associated H-X9-DG protein/prepilin-type N-terminal cleavage/methylation domain-containing protein